MTTPRDNRAASPSMNNDGNDQPLDSRRTTRSQSDSNPHLLAPPLASFRRRRSPTRDERLLSPNHCEDEEGIFEFPAPTAAMGDPDPTVQALTEALQGVRVSSRKPELPAFDPKNIDIWLKRVDNAYRRSGVTDPKDKFAFIEPKFAVDTDPRINELLFGDCTADDWTAFETYLRGRYGRTKSQQAAVILDGVQREGKLPSEMFALVKERIGSITVDDIIKEMVLRELPTDIRRTIHDKVKDLGGAETVKIADQYFDRNGKPIHKSPASSINAVDEVPGLIDTEDETDEVNAVGGRRFQRKSRPNRFQTTKPQQAAKPAGQSRHENASFTPAFSEKRTHTGKPTVKPVKLCRWHQQFGKEAFTCEAGCDKFQGFNAGKAKAGRQT